MGSEFGQGSEWNEASQLDWWLLKYPKHQGIQKLVKDLNNLYRREPALWKTDYDPESFRWLDVNDAEHSVFAMMRSNGDDHIFSVTNFTPVPYVAYRLGVPEPGTYEVIFDSDSKEYWGSGYGTGSVRVVASNISWQNNYHSIVLDLPPLSTIFIKKVDEKKNKLEDKTEKSAPKVEAKKSTAKKTTEKAATETSTTSKKAAEKKPSAKTASKSSTAKKAPAKKSATKSSTAKASGTAKKTASSK